MSTALAATDASFADVPLLVGLLHFIGLGFAVEGVRSVSAGNWTRLTKRMILYEPFLVSTPMVILQLVVLLHVTDLGLLARVSLTISALSTLSTLICLEVANGFKVTGFFPTVFVAFRSTESQAELYCWASLHCGFGHHSESSFFLGKSLFYIPLSLFSSRALLTVQSFVF